MAHLIAMNRPAVPFGGRGTFSFAEPTPDCCARSASPVCVGTGTSVGRPDTPWPGFGDEVGDDGGADVGDADDADADDGRADFDADVGSPDAVVDSGDPVQPPSSARTIAPNRILTERLSPRVSQLCQKTGTSSGRVSVPDPITVAVQLPFWRRCAQFVWMDCAPTSSLAGSL